MLRLLAVSFLVIALGACSGDRSPYVGTWRAAEQDSLGMRYTFFADGLVRIVERPTNGEPQTYEARYDIVGDSVLTLSDELGDGRFHIRLDGDTLRLTNPASGQQTAWVRL